GLEPLAGAQPVVLERVSTAVDARAAQPVAPHGGTPAGRVVLAAALAGAALAGGLAWLVSPGAPSRPTTIAITAHHSRFEPDRVKVKPNSTVRFVVHNADPIDHEFIIGPPETHALHERGTPHVHTGVTPGEITVPAGATVETTWTFGPSGSPAPGGPGASPRQGRREPPTIAYGCHLAGHWDYGMHGLATIR
ncbi:MAG TPA: cupredoxin domain-containing protein, partial [Acidimicrobiia bacterium]